MTADQDCAPYRINCLAKSAALRRSRRLRVCGLPYHAVNTVVLSIGISQGLEGVDDHRDRFAYDVDRVNIQRLAWLDCRSQVTDEELSTPGRLHKH
jgi:hypothetical protein